MTSIHFFGHPKSDFLGAVHSCGTWRKAVHKPVPFEGGEMLGSYKRPHTGRVCVGGVARAGTWFQSPGLGLKANTFLRGLQIRPRVETTAESLSGQTRGILKS